ncbi:unnamed protein product [Rotaria magnacalcarata]|uniref:RNA helicase n=6 Tax=Rotaria magnacalcarata TaxID=392030 RepID=A0A816B1G8_9BILA|nr:unnamed protein product [Rotaria magnacalcarata]
MNTNNPSLYFGIRGRSTSVPRYLPERPHPPPPTYSIAVAQLPPPQQQTAGVLEFVKQQIEINKTLANLMLKKEQHMVEQNSLMKQMINDKAEYYGKSGKQSQLGLHQHYVKLHKNEKTRESIKLIGKLQFNQFVIFVKSVSRSTALFKSLAERGFPAIEIHHEIPKEKRLARYKEFQEFETHILVATNLFGLGIDIERANIVLNYDMPEDTDTYLHRVARAGRLGTKGLAITYVANESDAAILNEIQSRFAVKITEMPDEIDADTQVTFIDIESRFTGP